MGPGTHNVWNNGNIMGWMQGQPPSAAGYQPILDDSLGIRFGGSDFGSSSDSGHSGSGRGSGGSCDSDSGSGGVYGW